MNGHDGLSVLGIAEDCHSELNELPSDLGLDQSI